LHIPRQIASENEVIYAGHNLYLPLRLGISPSSPGAFGIEYPQTVAVSNLKTGLLKLKGKNPGFID